MPIEFQLEERLAGFAGTNAVEGGQVRVVLRELIAPTDAVHLLDRLERMQGALFAKIPGAPPTPFIDHMLVIIRHDLTATAYINELQNIRAEVQVNRALDAGTPIFVTDIESITSIDLGVEIPDDCAFVLVRSFGWRRSLFFDFGPLHDDQPRQYPIAEALAQQQLLLIGLPPAPREAGEPAERLAWMRNGLQRFQTLITEECTDEAQYQELLEEHPWILGGLYSSVHRHEQLDDRDIPDFTATRCYDECHDFIELKQPFLKLFRKDDSFGSNFNDSWNQAERYLAFAERHRDYLLDRKQIRVENPRSIVVAGYGLTDVQRRNISEKEARSTSVAVLTYDELMRTAEHILRLVESAGVQRHV